MKNDRIFRAIGNINEDLIERTTTEDGVCPKEKSVRVTFAPWLKWAAPIAACLVIAVAIAVPTLLNRSSSEPVTDSGASTGVLAGGGGENGVSPGGGASVGGSGMLPANIGDIRGLPAGDYTWDEGDGIAADRMAMNELRYLMREFDSYDPNVKAAFVIVEAESVERFAEQDAYGTVREGQTARCAVLYDVLGDGIVEPLNIKQYLYGGCTSSEESNLLRVGGVYVLPIVTDNAPAGYNSPYYSDGSDVIWSVYGDLDVLFEVDDNRLIHSHSRWPELNKYDGVEVDYLWKDIGYLYMNPILRSRLAENIGQGYEVELAGDTVRLAYPAYGWDEADADGFSAKIVDGKITITASGFKNGFNVFRPVEGMTLDEMNAAIDKIKQYLGQVDIDLTSEVTLPNAQSTPRPVDAYDANAIAVLSPEDAEIRIVKEYARQGLGKVSVLFQAVTTLWGSADVYLFSVKFENDGTDGSEYAGIVIENGNLLRLEKLPDGGFAAFTGARELEEP